MNKRVGATKMNFVLANDKRLFYFVLSLLMFSVNEKTERQQLAAGTIDGKKIFSVGETTIQFTQFTGKAVFSTKAKRTKKEVLIGIRDGLFYSSKQKNKFEMFIFYARFV